MKNKLDRALIVIALLLPITTSAQYLREASDCDAGYAYSSKTGDLNNDGLVDSIFITYNVSQSSNISASVFFKNKNDLHKFDFIREIIISPSGGCFASPDFYIKNGCLIYEEIDYNRDIKYDFTNKFSPVSKKWYLYSLIIKEDIFSSKLESSKEIFFGPNSTFLGASYPFDTIAIVSKNKQKKILAEFKTMHKSCLTEFKSKVFSIIPNIKKEKLVEYCESIEMNNSNVFLFNDLAYFIIEYNIQNNQINDQFYFSITILENILYRYPHRSVALLNIGDAYWYSENKDLSNKAYQKYIELMKASGKECKIPQRVYDRVKY